MHTDLPYTSRGISTGSFQLGLCQTHFLAAHHFQAGLPVLVLPDRLDQASVTPSGYFLPSTWPSCCLSWDIRWSFVIVYFLHVKLHEVLLQCTIASGGPLQLCAFCTLGCMRICCSTPVHLDWQDARCSFVDVCWMILFNFSVCFHCSLTGSSSDESQL